MNGDGVIYFNMGVGHVERLAASLDSLRRHWGGPVSILNVGDVPPPLREAASLYRAGIVEIDDQGFSALATKVFVLRSTPFDRTVFLDADTIVCTPIDEFFEMLGDRDFVFTHFAGWKASGNIVRRRIERLRKAAIVDGELIDRALREPAINVGTFVYRKNAFLEPWFDLTARASRARVFIPDETVAQAHLPLLNYRLAPPEWGVSVRFEVGAERRRIVHYHGNKHDGRYPLCDLWRRHRDAAAAAIRLPLKKSDHRATLVVAVDRGYLETLKQNFPTWGFASQRPMAVIYHGVERSELDFLGPHPRLVPWDMPGVGQRERMLTSFVKLAPFVVDTDHWIKLDVDCRAEPGAALFSSRIWYRYDLVSHRWGYTKPGRWLCELEDWGDEAIGGDRLLSPEQHAEALAAKRYRFPRIQSFACLHRTEFSRYAAGLCGDRLPVPSHDTFIWYVAIRSGKSIRRENIKKWGYSHGKKVR